MRAPFLILLLSTALLTTACAASRPAPSSSTYSDVDDSFVEEGIASYYANQHEGRRTASGRVFDNSALTAAHRTLPFGTRLHVVNLDNGRDVVVTVTDRGPFRKARVIDVTRRAAKKLGFLRAGIARVRLEVVSG
jgi:rare lipoprotein A